MRTTDDDLVHGILRGDMEWARHELERDTTHVAEAAVPYLIREMERVGAHLPRGRRRDAESALRFELMRRQTTDLANGIEAAKHGLTDVLNDIYDNTTDWVREALDGGDPDPSRIVPQLLGA